MSPRKQSPVRRPAQQTRVRWWAVALPIAAFVALLSLIASPAAQAGEPGDRPANPVIEWVVDVTPQLLLGLLG